MTRAEILACMDDVEKEINEGYAVGLGKTSTLKLIAATRAALTPTPDIKRLWCTGCQQPYDGDAPKFFCPNCNGLGGRIPTPDIGEMPEDASVHYLKTWPTYFQAVEAGDKPFEVRLNDRDYHVGEYLVLQEYLDVTNTYTGRKITRRVTYVMRGGSFGIEPRYCVLGLAPVESHSLPVPEADAVQHVANHLVDAAELDPTSAKILHDNAWDLYDPKAPVPEAGGGWPEGRAYNIGWARNCYGPPSKNGEHLYDTIVWLDDDRQRLSKAVGYLRSECEKSIARTARRDTRVAELERERDDLIEERDFHKHFHDKLESGVQYKEGWDDGKKALQSPPPPVGDETLEGLFKDLLDAHRYYLSHPPKDPVTLKDGQVSDALAAIHAHIAAIVEKEREACAQICSLLASQRADYNEASQAKQLQFASDKIRARSSTPHSGEASS